MELESVMVLILVGLLVGLAVRLSVTDDSDKSFFTRSGARIITDYKTGLQYLEGVNGGIIPRLDGEGKQIKVAR